MKERPQRAFVLVAKCAGQKVRYIAVRAPIRKSSVDSLCGQQRRLETRLARNTLCPRELFASSIGQWVAPSGSGPKSMTLRMPRAARSLLMCFRSWTTARLIELRQRLQLGRLYLERATTIGYWL